jgi:hypothetical protein
MGVNQKAIADFLGLDRTTVTKILNRDPRYSASEETKEKVFRAAEILGYDFTTIRRPFKREYGRSDVSTPCEVTVTLENGAVFDTGTAVVRNLSVGGALLSGIVFQKQVLPLQNFTLLIKFSELPELAGLVGECELVRLAGSAARGEPEIGIRFVNATHRDRRRIQEYVDKNIRVRQAAGSSLESSRAEPQESAGKV